MVGLLFMALITYAFYVAIGNIQHGVTMSLSQAQKTSAHVDAIDYKVDSLVVDVEEIKRILKKERLWLVEGKRD